MATCIFHGLITLADWFKRITEPRKNNLLLQWWINFAQDLWSFLWLFMIDECLTPVEITKMSFLLLLVFDLLNSPFPRVCCQTINKDKFWFLAWLCFAIWLSSSIFKYCKSVTERRKQPFQTYKNLAFSIFILPRLFSLDLLMAFPWPSVNRLFLNVLSFLFPFCCDIFVCFLYGDWTEC